MPGTDTSRKASDGNSKLSCSPNVLCFHTIVGYAPALAAHFSVRADGYIWQHRDTKVQSAANYQGNPHVIAVETEDHGSAFGSWSGSNVPSWTPAQVEALAKIAVWVNKTHGIPLVPLPNSKRASTGIGFHRQGIDGNFPNGRVAGGEVWSTSTGKVCPGDRRIAQIPGIIARAKQIVGGDDIVTPQDIEAIAAAVWNRRLWHPSHPTDGITAEQDQAWTNQYVNDLVVYVKALTEKVDSLESKVDQVSTPDVNVDQLAVALVNAGLSSGLTVDQVVDAVKKANRDQWTK